jgi:3-methylcrotonyl-CoA carboxylase alpha subunit
MKIMCGERVREVRIEGESAVLDGARVAVGFSGDGAAGAILDVAGTRHRIRAARAGEKAFVWCDGVVYEFSLARRVDRGASEHGALVAPMPGRIRQTLVSEGDAVHKGQVLLVLEAMKMEHAIRAPRAGSVARLPHREGELVEAGTALVELV